MSTMTLREHTTALFTIALYSWFFEDEATAEEVIEIAVRSLNQGQLLSA